MPTTHAPDAADALFTNFEGVPFRDPGSTEYVEANPDRVDAKFFLKPIQDETLNLIRKVNRLELDDAAAALIARSNAMIFSSYLYH